MENAKRNTHKSKEKQCRYCHRHMGKHHNESHCVVDGWGNNEVRTVTPDICEQCDRFDSKFIQYPLTIQGIENKKVEHRGMHECGCLCELTLCQGEHSGKAYLGIYIGDLPIAITSSHNRADGILTNQPMYTPAMFVPALKKIVYGYESYWRELETLDDVQDITEDDSDNTWYVQLLRSYYQ